ncbi:MAG: RidA family protein [Trueperaceae bacterium]|nr:RidA family protein [Trueperaceae bacterium]
MNPESKLAELGYPVRLPPPAPPRPYEPLVQIGSIVYGSGNTSIDRHAGKVFAGQVGGDVDVAQAREYARVAMINALAGLKAHLGELSRVKRFVRVTGYVNSHPEFTQQADVMNAASDLLVAAFGDAGRHARSAIGVAQLPGGAAVEVEVIVEVDQ